MFRSRRGLAQCVNDRGTLHYYGWLLVPRKMGNGRFVDASSRINVDGVDDFGAGLGVLVGVMLILVLSRRGQ